jgi:hypothetical protein
VEAEGKGGEQRVGEGSPQTMRLAYLGDLIVSELQGRFYEQNRQGRLFVGGMTLTAINNASFTSATTGVTAAPLVGVYNPPGNDVDLVILQAILALTMTALQATGPGPFVWMANANAGEISAGNAPTNAKTLRATGSEAKDVSGVALAGMSNALRFIRASSLGGGSASNVAFLGTQVGMQAQLPPGDVENIDGGFIVQPGGVLALMATTTAVAHSAVSGLIWDEVPAGKGA